MVLLTHNALFSSQVLCVVLLLKPITHLEQLTPQCTTRSKRLDQFCMITDIMTESSFLQHKYGPSTGKTQSQITVPVIPTHAFGDV